MIALRYIFIYISYKSDLLSAPTIFIPCYNYLIFDTIIVEHSNIFVLYMKNQIITKRRILCVICDFLLIIQSMIYQNYLPLLFFSVNHMCNLVKDVCGLFFKNFWMANLMYGIIKPFYLSFLLLISFFLITNWHEIIVPVIVTSWAIYDADKRLPNILSTH